ncbi:hypothetical protein DL769_011422 [Monosporascus sp. CRB-8-3]|nr:hypothetical protein DL769_011422 [Monosporascus sp. CRB-8-3]
MASTIPVRPVLLALLFYISSAVCKCYYPNGDEAALDNPCNPDAESSACCAGGSYGNIYGMACLSNNLCLGANGRIVRGTCTEQGWSGEGCAHYCMASEAGGADMISCSNATGSDTSYCCDGEAGCCDSGVGRFEVLPSNAITTATWNSASSRYLLVATLSSAKTSQMLTSTSTPARTTSSTSSPSEESDVPPASTRTPDTASQLSSELSPGAKAGIGVGVSLGALILAVLAGILWKMRNTKDSGPGSASLHNTTLQTTFTGTFEGGRAELQSELPGHYQHAHELAVGHSSSA